MTQRQQEELIQRVLDHEFSLEDVATFRAAFRSDPDFRRRYCDHAIIVSHLETSVNPRLVMGGGDRHGTRSDRLRRKLFAKSWIWAAAAVLILSLAGRFIYLRPWLDREVAQLSLSAGTHWTLTRAGGVQSQYDAPETRTLSPGSSLTLEQGVAGIGLPSGTKVFLSGASRLTYQGNNRFLLDRGNVWFDIPAGAGGVVLTTPRSRVADQGTEFGVISTADRPDEIHVEAGEVLVEGLLGRKKRAVVRATRAVSVDFAGNINELRLDTSAFAKDMPRTLPYLHWSFDTFENGGGYTTDGEHPRLGEIKANYRTLSATPLEKRRGTGVIGNSLRFDQPGDMVITSYPGMSGNGPRTLAFWIRIPPDRLQTVGHETWIGLLGWGRRHHPEHDLNESIHAIMGTPRLADPGANSARTWVPILSFEGVWFEGVTDLTDGAWHHVLWTYSGKTGPDGMPLAKCYCDGRPEEVKLGGADPQRLWHWPPKIDILTDDEKSVPFLIGASLRSIDDPTTMVPAELDEVFVIEGEVDAADARRIFLENRYAPAGPQPIAPEDAKAK